MRNKRKKNIKDIIKSIGMLILFIFIFQSFFPNNSTIQEKSYNEFMTMVQEEKIEKVSIDLVNSDMFEFVDKEGNIYTTDNPKIDNFKEFLLTNNVKVIEKNNAKYSNLISTIISFVFYAALFYFIFKKIAPQTQELPQSSSTLRQIPETTFDDIAGHKEVKKDLQFVVDYFKDPNKYKQLGAKMPKGIALYGPTGTGKTLIARAIAGTSNVSFISANGADFVEMYVGRGAGRVRSLYENARKMAPCIVFIDEIDAIGGKRTNNQTHSEQRQTIDALLSELDGFNGNEGVLTICATNTIESLDEALMRPGRFDKIIAVPLPEREDRLEIMKIHGADKKFDESVNFETLATMTIGFSGAALATMLNEAAFIAISQNHNLITETDIESAFYKMVLKGNKKEDFSSRDKEELKVVSWHEAGHAIATKLYTEDSVPKVTITASTSGARGVTFRTPKEMSLYSKSYLKSLVKVMYAGRAAEEILFGNKEEITTGASNDIKQATEIIKQYVSIFGMNEEYGPIDLTSFSQIDNEELIKCCSDLAKNLYKEVYEDLLIKKECINSVANELLAKETINEDELDKIIKEHFDEKSDKKSVDKIERETFEQERNDYDN